MLSLIFYGVWLISVTRNDADVKQTSPKELRRAYNIRVMIPCKDESLSVVRRTISAVRRAVIPGGCHIIVYLCDEARDTAKRNYVNGLKGDDIDVIYITGELVWPGKYIPFVGECSGILCIFGPGRGPSDLTHRRQVQWTTMDLASLQVTEHSLS